MISVRRNNVLFRASEQDDFVASPAKCRTRESTRAEPKESLGTLRSS
jgi:hypothetical protein